MESIDWSALHTEPDPLVMAEAARNAATHDRWVDPCDQIVPGQTDTEPTWLALQNQGADWTSQMQRMFAGLRTELPVDTEVSDVIYSA